MLINNYDDAMKSKQTLHLGLGTFYVSKDLMVKLDRLVSLDNARGTLYSTQIWSKSTESGCK
jgi:hypothetical protein